MILGVALAQPAVFGIVNGAAFGLVAIGLVMIYKSSRVFNFAAGEFVTLGAFGAYIGVKILGLPYFLAAVLGIAAGTAFGLVTERLVVRPLADRPKV
ncbi:MAG: branched-chain amino acid ABC transporter permease, partial [Acidimicrobiia bacterium]|nr:branched-chain amino acid ABC transporter permease [Acidimicrobiia bacterium]